MIISIKNLSFSYNNAEKEIFKNVNFSFDTDWKIGLISRNGYGKTTLLKILTGELDFSGEIVKNVNFDYFPYNINDKNIDCIELVYLINPQADLWEIIQNFEKIKLNEDILYRKFSTLSYGEQSKFMLSILFSKQNNFLLIDEPTNHLDDISKNNIKDFLKLKNGFILVSHDRSFLDDTVNHIISINKTNIDIQKGNFSTWWTNKNNQDNFEIEKNKKLKKEIDTLQKSIKETARWSNLVENTKSIRNSGVKPDKGFVSHKASKMMARSKAIEKRKDKMVEEKKSLLKNIEKDEDLFIYPLNTSIENFLEFKDVSISYNNNLITKNVNFKLNYGDRLCLQGSNGSGKSSIIKLIMGENISYNGTIYKNSRVKISYCPQKFNYDGSINQYVIDENINQKLFFALLDIMGFNINQLNHNISSLSEGEKRKIILSKTLSEESSLYIFDEPLNYIDVITKIQLENLFLSKPLTMIFVEHDKDFVNKVATKIIKI